MIHRDVEDIEGKIESYYFLENHGTNTLVFFLYSSHSGLHSYRASWSGTPETKRRRQVIVIQPISQRREYGTAMHAIPSQNILSPK